MTTRRWCASPRTHTISRRQVVTVCRDQAGAVVGGVIRGAPPALSRMAAATAGGPVDAMECRDERSLLTQDLAQVTPAQVERRSTGGLDDDLGR